MYELALCLAVLVAALHPRRERQRQKERAGRYC